VALTTDTLVACALPNLTDIGGEKPVPSTAKVSPPPAGPLVGDTDVTVNATLTEQLNEKRHDRAAVEWLARDIIIIAP